MGEVHAHSLSMEKEVHLGDSQLRFVRRGTRRSGEAHAEYILIYIYEFVKKNDLVIFHILPRM